MPVHNDCKLFEFLILEGAQAGLSWLTVLRKRANYRAALGGFHPAVISRYQKKDVLRLLLNGGIIRNRAKIEAMITNAKMFESAQENFRGRFNPAFHCDQPDFRPEV